MNWIPQLVTGGDDKIVALVPEALEARGLCRQKQYGRALGILWQMLRLARRSDSKEREAFVLIHIGKVYRNWIWDIALKFFRDGLAAAQGCGFKRGEMIANNAIGELYYAWGKQDEALKYTPGVSMPPMNWATRPASGKSCWTWWTATKSRGSSSDAMSWSARRCV